MKGFPRLFLVLIATIAILVSACGGNVASPAETSVGGNKPLASLVEVQGYIEAISGNQWTVDGQVITVDSSLLDGGDDLSSYQVGDYIEIKAEVSTDGSLVAKEVDDSSADGNENDDSNSNDNSNSNDDDSNSNDDSNDNDDDSNSNDDSNDNDDDSNSNDDSNGNDDDSNSNDDSNGNDDDSNSNDDSNGNDDDENENDD